MQRRFLPRLAVPVAVVSVSLSACAATTSRHEPRLELSCAVDSSSGAPVLSVLARLTPVPDASGPPTDVALAVGDASYRLALDRELGQGVGTFPNAAVATGSEVTGSAPTAVGVVRSACTVGAGLPPPNPSALATSSGAVVSWPAVTGAAVYRVRALDFGSGAVLASTSAVASPETLRFASPPGSIVMVELVAEAVVASQALAEVLPLPSRSQKRVLLSAGTSGGSGASWQLFAPGDFVDGTLEVKYASLDADEHIAVILANAGGGDHDVNVAPITLSMTGPSGAAGLPGGIAAALQPTSDVPAPPGAARVSEQERLDAEGKIRRHHGAPPAITGASAPEVGDRRGLCVCDWARGSCASSRRARATVRARTTHAAFWVDDATQAGFDAAIANGSPNLWQDLGAVYENAVLPALERDFGAVSDIDRDGVMSILFTDLGPAVDGGMMTGYFDVRDVYYPADVTPECDLGAEGQGSNGLDLVYIRDLASFATVGSADFTPDRVLTEFYPNALAHELQHDVNFNQRWLLDSEAATHSWEEAWLDEALSCVAEDAIGYGLGWPAARNTVRRYLLDYPAYSLTAWDGDVYGSYGGARAFLRYFVDRLGEGLTQQLERPGLAGKQNFEAATGIPFDLALAQFVTASVFSNEASSPDPLFDYAGPAWTPWHAATGSAEHDGLRAGQVVAVDELRADGWRTFITGDHAAGAVAITVHDGSDQSPYVVAVRFRGASP